MLIIPDQYAQTTTMKKSCSFNMRFILYTLPVLPSNLCFRLNIFFDKSMQKKAKIARKRLVHLLSTTVSREVLYMIFGKSFQLFDAFLYDVLSTSCEISSPSTSFAMSISGYRTLGWAASTSSTGSLMPPTKSLQTLRSTANTPFRLRR